MQLFLPAFLTLAVMVDSNEVGNLDESDQMNYQVDNGLACYAGNIQIGNETLTQQDVMTEIESQVTAAVLQVANTDPTLLDFLKTQGTCQADCLVMVMRPTFSTLYGKLGEDFVNYENQEVQSTFVEAISGAFKACYPFEPREEVRKVAETIFANIGTNITIGPGDTFPAGQTCRNQGFEYFFPVESFLTSFEGTIMDAMEMSPRLKKYYETEALDCQKTCIEQTVPAAAMTLFLNDNYDESTEVEALTGAVHACFPSVSSEDLQVLVSETKEVMADTRETAADLFGDWQKGDKTASLEHEDVKEAMLKRRAGRKQRRDSAWSPYLILFVLSTIIMSLGLFVGMTIGRRWERSAIMNTPLTMNHLMATGNHLLPTVFGKDQRLKV